MKGMILFLIITGIMAAGCVSNTPEETPWINETIPPQLAPEPTPIRTPPPPVETAPSPDPTPTPTPRITSTLCDYPPCGQGGGGGGGGSSGGGTPPPPICELPTVLLVLAGIGVVAICAGQRR